MLGEAFASNPIGVQFDPEELVREFRRGVAVEKLLARPAGPGGEIPRAHGIGA
jgi:hypothetical protein